MHPFPKGCLFLHIKRANNLVAKDNIKMGKLKLISGKSDPYIDVKLGSQEYRTKIKKQTLDPIWDEKLCLLVSNPSLQKVKIDVFDDDEDQGISNFDSKIIGIKDITKFSEPDELGKTTVNVSEIYQNKKRVNFIDELEETAHGSVEIDYYWISLVNSHSVSGTQRTLKNVISLVIETVYEVPKFIQSKYPQCCLHINSTTRFTEDLCTLNLPTTELISFDKEFFFLQDPDTEGSHIKYNLTLKSTNVSKSPIAFIDFDLDLKESEDREEVISYYKDLTLHYHQERYRNREFPQMRLRVGVRVKRAIGEIEYQKILSKKIK